MKDLKNKFYPFPTRVHYDVADQVLYASFVAEHEDAGIVIYNKKNSKRVDKIKFSPEDHLGKIRYGHVKIEHPENVYYTFFDGEKEFSDERGRLFLKEKYGNVSKPVTSLEHVLKASIITKDYDWEGDMLPQIPYEDAICYGMHVRGFTKHSSSGVKAKGTFEGIREKIPYLKELGITTIVLQPAYEFDESVELRKAAYLQNVREHIAEKGNVSASVMEMAIPTMELQYENAKVNYWGYCRGYYYAPKASYAYGPDACSELKDLIKELHKNQMELMMQFYFTDDFDRMEIRPILRYWAYEYHVDGFHLMGRELPADELAKDPGLCDRKLWYYTFHADHAGMHVETYKNLASFHDDFMYPVRRFVRGEDGQTYVYGELFRRNSNQMGFINHLTDYTGFTLKDLYMFDRKHNEENGENNKDGNDYNCSWNCGIEGECKKKKIVMLRNTLRKNALVLMLLAQGTPYFFMGDEFLRTQKGNNNPYCQDNSVTWMNYNALEQNKDFYDFVKKLIAFRKEHPIFHRKDMLEMSDRGQSGYPELSFHGETPWKPDFFPYQHHLGIMLRESVEQKDTFFYLAINMHWENKFFSLPKLSKNMNWKVILATGEKSSETNAESNYEIPQRSIVLFQSTKIEKEHILKHKS